MINLNDKFSINKEKIACRIIDNQAIIVAIGKSSRAKFIYTLNSTGTRIWGLLEKNIKLKDIIQILGMEFEVDCKKAKREVVKFIKELLKRKVVNIN